MPVLACQRPVGERVLATFAPHLLVVFVLFLLTGIALPVLPFHVHRDLGLSAFVVGLVSGCQFAASLVSRIWSGRHADMHGAKGAVMAGLVAAVAAGILYLVSLRFTGTPRLSVALLIAGRALLGGAGSFVTTGALSWGLVFVYSQSAGKVMSWVGTAMYAALAVGAPLGNALYARFGFDAIALATSVVPLVVLLFVARLRPVAPKNVQRPSLACVIGAVWLPGLGLALSSLGFSAITAFIGLLFAARGGGASMASFQRIFWRIHGGARFSRSPAGLSGRRPYCHGLCADRRLGVVARLVRPRLRGRCLRGAVDRCGLFVRLSGVGAGGGQTDGRAKPRARDGSLYSVSRSRSWSRRSQLGAPGELGQAGPDIPRECGRGARFNCCLVSAAQDAGHPLELRGRHASRSSGGARRLRKQRARMG